MWCPCGLGWVQGKLCPLNFLYVHSDETNFIFWPYTFKLHFDFFYVEHFFIDTWNLIYFISTFYETDVKGRRHSSLLIFLKFRAMWKLSPCSSNADTVIKCKRFFFLQKYCFHLSSRFKKYLSISLCYANMYFSFLITRFQNNENISFLSISKCSVLVNSWRIGFLFTRNKNT